MPRVLLTNDDGIQAPGLRALAAQMAQWCEVTVVAPSKPRSATSHSITLHKPLRLSPAEAGCAEYKLDNVSAFDCSGTPSDCVMLGVLHLMKDAPPCIVISGINDGMNVAEDLTYSGTVGGALEGAVMGVPSIAASLAGHRRMNFAEAAEVLDALVSYLARSSFRPETEKFAQIFGVPGSTSAAEQDCDSVGDSGFWLPDGLTGQFCLNVNIPDVKLEDVRGVKWTRAGRRIYEDIINVSRDPNGRDYYWLGGTKVLDENIPDSDTLAISEGYISLTPVTYDITHYTDLDKFEPWFSERYLRMRGQKRHGE